MGDTAHWEPLSPACRVLVDGEHGFTTDTILLADFSLPTRGERCADFGTGCGAIPLLWAARGKPGPLWGVELQEGAVSLARRSVEENGLSGRITILQGDVGQIRGLLPHQGLDLVACNPPYTRTGAGLPSPGDARRLARQDGTLTLSQVAQAARYVLRFGGRLCLCLRPQRLAEAVTVLQGARLEPKRLRFVQARADKAPTLFLLECRLGGRPGLEVAPTLLLDSPECEAIYGEYRAAGGGKAG